MVESLPVMIESMIHHESKSWMHKFGSEEIIELVLIIMFAFIRKRLPSKERTLDQDEDQTKKSRSEEKKKKKSTTTIDGLVFHPDPSPTVNQSYSETDYFPLRSTGMLETKTTPNSREDCYMTASNTGPTRPPVIKSRIIDIPITIVKK